MVLTSPLSARLVCRVEPIDILSCLLSTFPVRSNLVRRPKSGAGRAASPKTARRGSATTSRKALFGGASAPSPPVRRCTRACPCVLARAERVLLERAAGPSSRCPSTQVMISAATDTYVSRCTWPSPGMRPSEVAVGSTVAPRVCRRVCGRAAQMYDTSGTRSRVYVRVCT